MEGKNQEKNKYRRNIFIVYNIWCADAGLMISSLASLQLRGVCENNEERRRVKRVYESLHKTLECTPVVTMLALN